MGAVRGVVQRVLKMSICAEGGLFLRIYSKVGDRQTLYGGDIEEVLPSSKRCPKGVLLGTTIRIY
jgi:hypothetical protein